MNISALGHTPWFAVLLWAVTVRQQTHFSRPAPQIQYGIVRVANVPSAVLTWTERSAEAPPQPRGRCRHRWPDPGARHADANAWKDTLLCNSLNPAGGRGFKPVMSSLSLLNSFPCTAARGCLSLPFISKKDGQHLQGKNWAQQQFKHGEETTSFSPETDRHKLESISLGSPCRQLHRKLVLHMSYISEYFFYHILQ